MLTDLRMDDIVRLRKPHPCGGTDWKVTRLGADIRIKCLACGRSLLLPRRDLSKKMKSVVTDEFHPDLPTGETE